AGEADLTSAEALSLARAQYAADPSRENRRLLQVSLERHGVVQAILADTEQAEQCYREMLDLVEWGIAHDAGAADPEDVATHVHALLALADSVLRGNEPDNARELLLKAYEVQQSRANLAESSTEDVRRLMGIRLSLAELVAAQGEFENAWEWVAPVLPAARELFESTPRADHRLALCAALERASDVAWAGGNMELAVALVSEAVERMEGLSPPHDVAYAWRLARLYRELAEHRQMADVSVEVREGLSDEDYEGGIARTLRRSLNGARALLACDPAIGWMVAEIAGRLGGHLMLRNRLHKGSPYASAGLPGESSGGSIGGREGTGNDLEALRHELAAAIGARENGEETWGNWYQGGLFALEAMANAARDIGMAGTCVAAHELALELVLEYATEVPGDEAFEDLLHWIILSGHNLLLLNARPDPQLVLQCARAVLAGPRSEETDGTGTFRSAACSILATLGADIPADDRMLLHREATEWFERYPSPMATLAGYESEIECGVLDHDCATR